METKLNSDTLKALSLQYWRYDKQCPVVALEYDNSDVLAVSTSRRLIETEVKISIPDLKRDIQKPKHFRFREALQLDTSAPYPEWQELKRSREMYPLDKYPVMANSLYRLGVYEFWFALASDIADAGMKVIEEMYPYAGVFAGELYGKDYLYIDASGVRKGGLRVLRDPCRFKKAERMNFRHLSSMVKSQSATLTRLALEIGFTKED